MNDESPSHELVTNSGKKAVSGKDKIAKTGSTRTGSRSTETATAGTTSSGSVSAGSSHEGPGQRAADIRPTFPGRRERTRSRLARLAGWSTESYSPILEPLLRIVRAKNPKEDLDLLQRAFVVAEKYHEGQKRKSGDPYITHPVAVATILAEMGLGGSTLAAALLHDTVEDTPYTLAQLEHDFGKEITLLVDGVTKLDKVDYGEAAQAETLRKMVVAMSKDIRVLVIKLADRLHNARTWRFVSAQSSSKKARETLDIFAPLAHRLGMNAVKWELEELSFAALYPKVYEEIVRLVQDRSPEREKQLSLIRRELLEVLRVSKIKGEVSGRPKHYYSIYQKMVVRSKEFDDINDLIGVRVMVDTVGDCYAMLGEVHSLWTPLVGRFKDYIALPKFNMYQSLHTTVLGPGGKLVEIQIRTREMHQRAEYGVAAHWMYKSGNKGPAATNQDDMSWLHSLMDWQRETADPGEFLDSMRFEMNTKEVYVFTPKGQVVALPAGATPVDFAYSVHTEVGHRTIGARVNGKLVPLNSELANSDTVEIFTNKAEGAGPSQDWQNFVKSPRARNKIRQWFSKERRDESIEKGKELLTKALRKQNLPLQKMMTHDSLMAVTEHFHYQDITGLYAAVGDGHTSAQSVVERLREVMGLADIEEVAPPLETRVSNARSRVSSSGVIVHGVDDVLVKLARCCTPVPPDPISGFVTKGSGISVHRSDCPNLLNLQHEPDKLVEVDWAPTQSGVFLVEIQVEALDRKSLLSDVTRILAENHVNILAASVNTSTNRVAISKFAFEMGDPKYLDHVLNAVRRIDGVYDVYRATGSHRRA